MADIPLRFLSSSHGARAVYARIGAATLALSRTRRSKSEGPRRPHPRQCRNGPKSSGWMLVPRAMQSSVTGMASALHVARCASLDRVRKRLVRVHLGRRRRPAPSDRFGACGCRSLADAQALAGGSDLRRVSRDSRSAQVARPVTIRPWAIQTSDPRGRAGYSAPAWRLAFA
jgi:hypothetical protein